MNAREAIQTSLNSTREMVGWYLSDLSDADLLVRPVPGANHIAWQLGHLIKAESDLLKQHLPGAAYPELPVRFSGQAGKAPAAVAPPKGFLTKAAYLELFNRSRAATLAAVDKLSDADFDKPMT